MRKENVVASRVGEFQKAAVPLAGSLALRRGRILGTAARAWAGENPGDEAAGFDLLARAELLRHNARR